MGKKLNTLILMMLGMLVSSSAVANTLPVAAFNTTLNTGLGVMNVQFDGSISTDSDGTIVSYSWNFGDGDVTQGLDLHVSFVRPEPATGMWTVTVEHQFEGKPLWVLPKRFAVAIFTPKLLQQVEKLFINRGLIEYLVDMQGSKIDFNWFQKS